MIRNPQVDHQLKFVVSECIARTLELSPEQIEPQHNLVYDLGLDSIDVMDVLYRIEKKLGVAVQLKQFPHYFRGALPPEQFSDENGHVSEAGLEQLQKLFPGAVIQKPLHIGHLFHLFTVEDLVLFVHKHKEKEAVSN